MLSQSVADTLLKKAVVSSRDHKDNIEHGKIIKFILRQKNVVVSSEVMSECYYQKNTQILSLLFKSSKLSNKECCEGIVSGMNRRRSGSHRKTVCKQMKLRLQSCSDKRQRRIMNRIINWLERRLRKANGRKGANSGLTRLNRDLESVNWTN